MRKGKGIMPKKSGGAGAGKGGKRLRPCFMCGKPRHRHVNSPGRFSKGGYSGKATSKAAYLKGAGKGFKMRRGKKAYLQYIPYSINVLTTMNNNPTTRKQTATKVILDTGATDPAIGLNILARLIDGGRIANTVSIVDQPVFRFGRKTPSG